jgi:pilus assembly protein CpaC
MKSIVLASTLALLMAAPAAAETTSGGATLTLMVGKSHLFTTPSGFERVAVSDPKVADVRVISDKQLLIQALKPGDATIFVWTKQSGAVSYELHVGLDTKAVQQQVRSITGNDAIKVDFNGSSFILSGPTQSAVQREEAEKIAAGSGAPVINLLAMPQRREQIKVELVVVELSKTGLLNLGVSPGGGETTGINNGIRQFTFKPGSINLGEAQPNSLSSFGPLDTLMAQIQLLQTKGEAKLLARPTLTTIDGGTAKFLAGGEIPIPVSQALGVTTIAWKEFGVRLEVTPTITTDGRIAMSCKPEVSSLDYANGLKQASFTIPSLKTRKADTQVVLAANETLMIGGLMNNEDNKTWDQIPGIGDIPIIGELIKSRRFQNNQTELAIFVTPRLVTADNDSTPSTNLDKVQKDMSAVP